MHPRLSRTLGILMLGLLVGAVGLAATPRDSTSFRQEAWWEPITRSLGGFGFLVAIACVVVIALGLIRGEYLRAEDD